MTRLTRVNTVLVSTVMFIAALQVWIAWLKLAHVVMWSLWVVFLPLIIPGIIVLLFLALGVWIMLSRTWNESKRRKKFIAKQKLKARSILAEE